MHLVDPEPQTSTFTTTEVARLASYRAAVAAGLYSDWDGSAAHTDTEVLAWLPRATAEGAARPYPFTRAERAALERLRERYAAGGFADDRPAPGAAEAPPSAGSPSPSAQQ
jgi:hypothetical protein